MSFVTAFTCLRLMLWGFTHTAACIRVGCLFKTDCWSTSGTSHIFHIPLSAHEHLDELNFGDTLKRAEASFITINSTGGLISPWPAYLGSHSNSSHLESLTCFKEKGGVWANIPTIKVSTRLLQCPQITEVPASVITCFGNEVPKKLVACCQSVVDSIGNSV